MNWLGVFVAMALTDYVWARYIAAVSDELPSSAGFYSAAIILLGGFVTLEYVRDPWLIVPCALGAFVGTWLSVKHGKAQS